MSPVAYLLRMSLLASRTAALIWLACQGALLLARDVLRGDVLAYTDAATDTRNIYMLDVRTRIQRNISGSPNDDYQPAWSPDGRHVAFISNRDGAYRVYVTDAAGRNEHLLTPRNPEDRYDFVSYRGPHWSPDGDWVIFRRAAVPGAADHPTMLYRARFGRDLHVLDYDEDDAQHYLNTIRQQPNLAPDGQRVMYVDHTEAGWRLLVGEPDQPLNSLEPLTDHDIVAGVEPQWSPDGKRIAFAAQVGSRSELFVIDPDSGRAHQVTYNGGTRPVWRP
jgi:Tol biopolymer transport system component